MLPELVSEVRNGTLTLTQEKGNGFSTTRIPRFQVTASELLQLDLAGSGTVRASKLTGSSLTIVLSGSGTLTAAGEIDQLTATLTGSGTVDAAELKAKRAKAAVTGSGDMIVNSDELEAVLIGSGDIYYLGAPKLSQRVTGSGKIQKK